MNSRTPIDRALPRLRIMSLAVGLIAAIPATAGAFLQSQLFFPAYLTAFLFWWSIALGCLALSMLHHLTGGGWGTAIRRPLEAGCGTLPWLAVLFVPVLCGLSILYVWARPDAVALDATLRHKAAYLNSTFFQSRAAIYFAIWIALAFATNWLSARSTRDTTTSNDWLVAISGPGMILWVLTTTFAAIDWTMSLDPHWLSSIHGLIFIAGEAVSALAFVIVIVVALRQLPTIAAELDESRLQDLGNLLLAFTLFWTYASFTQYLVIWSGNLPEETRWYLRRDHGGWQWVALLLIGLHFVVPFLLLLSRAFKRHPNTLLGICTLLLVMRAVEFYWHVMPTFSASALAVNWLSICTFIAMGGLWLAAFTQGLATRLDPSRAHLLEAAQHEYAN